MLTSVELQNFGPLAHVQWPALGKINLIIGANGKGKTFLLKALYAAVKTLETYKRGDDKRSAAEILADKLYWTFQTDKLGELVSRGAHEVLKSKIEWDGRAFDYEFGARTTNQIGKVENHVDPISSNSIFLPAKEVLSLHSIILKSRDEDRVFGFDDTYLDLARALQQSPRAGKSSTEVAASRQRLEAIIGGKVEFDVAAQRWQYRDGKNQRFQVGVTAEGVKKIAILDTLLGNRYLGQGSVVFIDEPEAALHPAAIGEFMEIVSLLANRGIQFFMATHSYFVVKKLGLVAKAADLSIPVLCAGNCNWGTADLRNGTPDNPIMDEAIKLYEAEVEASLS